jgi:UDP-GlcNAc:undecaprenyl-phosphate GlcNAc-1-phosphate transferase
MGGVAIFASFLLVNMATLLWSTNGTFLIRYVPLLLCGLLVFVLGIIDDFYHLHPQTKLVGQLVVAAILVSFGFKISWFTSHTLNTFVSIFWIVSITNAFNLLDNMDGLAAGIACISSLFLALIILVSHGERFHVGEVLILSVLVGALLGFLIYNFEPASIFMGDCGSMFIGFLLAGVTTDQQMLHSSHILPIILVPVLILFIPILDTGFVSIMRTLFGRSIARGGKDHSSHRLVAIGLPERRAVLMLYGFSIIGGAVALVGVLYRPTYFFTCLVIFLLISLFFWIYLGKVRVYPDQRKTVLENDKSFTAILVDFTYKRRIFEVILDVFLISFGYWFSYFLRFEETHYGSIFPLFLKTLPIVLACLVFSYLIFGIYRGVWRYTSVRDLIAYSKAVTFGVVLSVLTIVYLYHFRGFSRSVFVIFWGITLLSLAGSRLSFRIIAETLRGNAQDNGRRVLIYGAGDKGHLALREILHNHNLGMTPVGFIDDDVRKHKSMIQGYKVLGGRDRLADLVDMYDISELIIASRNIHPENFQASCLVCEELGVTLRNLKLSIK